MDAPGATILLVLTIASFVVAVVMLVVALGPLREGRERGHADDADLPGPFAPDGAPPLGAGDDGADEHGARARRSPPGEPGASS